MKELFGTQGKVLTYDIIEYLSSLITESVVITIGETSMSILDLAVKYRELSSVVQKTANTKATQLGIEFSNVVIESISLPDEVEQMIDEQSGIGMASKDMNTFMKYQTARAMRDASKQEGGLAGLGAGMALGNTMAGTISNATSFETNCKSSADQLRELKNLLDEGILTQEEFDAKKKQILGL
ncbi:MAG TPA: hypothetical protein DCM59_05310 [Clostridium sp.]|nr:hypothetical protein [Clostridium sp.]